MKKSTLITACLFLCAASAAAEPITTTPSGKVYDEVYRSATTWLVQGAQIGRFNNYGYNGSIVVDGENIYISKYVSEISDKYWIKGTVKDGVAEFVFPQDVPFTAVAGGKTQNATINVLEPTETGGSITMVPAADNVLRMSWDGSKLTQIVPEMTNPAMASYAGLVGLLNESGAFLGYAEKNATLEIWTTPVTELPLGVTTVNYMLTGRDNWGNDLNVSCKVAIDGEDVYVQGLNRLMAAAWAKGKLVDGNIVFESGEYLGINQGGYYNFLYGATGTEYQGFKFEPTLTLAKTATGYEASSVTLVNNGNQGVWNASYITGAKLEPQPVTIQTPVAPTMEDFEWDEDEEMGAFGVFFELIDTEGMPLEPENTFYTVILDGEPLSFENTAGEKVTEFPYNLGEGEDMVMFDRAFMMTAGDGYKLFFTFEPISSASAITIYHNGDKTTYSQSADWAGIEDVTVSDDVIATEYYNLQGARVDTPSAGIYLRRDISSNGKSTVTKTVIR
ncbi:MAG: hypothetical protein Q4C34_08330 [Bacteroidales bacterium]|nr:hypothetical protein [Bacteroidales bacterium]